MKVLSSRSNPMYRQWQADFKHAGRPGHGAWLEGVHLCQAWLQHRGQPQWGLFAQESADHADIMAIAHQTELARQVWMPQKLLDGLSTLVTAPPVIFIGQIHEPARLDDLLTTSVLLDSIQDPGNVGTILRTVAAAGVGDVFTGRGTAACWSPKVLRAGQGAQFCLSMHESIDLAKLIALQQTNPKRLPVMVTTLDAQAESLYETDLRREVIWVFGHEGRGVSPELVELADHRVYIPHDTQAVESLNVTSAAAICLFEQRRQRLTK
jgi:TrmH family RNA methyltransferase